MTLPPLVRLTSAPVAAAVLATVAAPALAFAADAGDHRTGGWWLPPNYSVHGRAIDNLFHVIFWLSAAVFVVVQVTLIAFLVRYRHRKGQRHATFTHGNTRLEMAWTVVPAVLLTGLSLASKRVWDDYRHAPTATDPTRATVLVIGQQFKWNVIYPGPDGKLGRYLQYPKPTDARWPGGVRFAGVDGPAALPHEQAVRAINTYVDQDNPLGKDVDDPDGKDDDWSKQPGRPLELPADRPIEVQVASKDVIHSFALPNFRVKLDAVPGMRGKIYFTTTPAATSVAEVSVDDPSAKGTLAWVGPTTPGAVYDRRARDWFISDPTDPKKARSLIRHNRVIDDAAIARLRAGGVSRVAAVLRPFDLVCEELCGQGHAQMQATVVFLPNDAYRAKYEAPPVSRAASRGIAPPVILSGAKDLPARSAKPAGCVASNGEVLRSAQDDNSRASATGGVR